MESGDVWKREATREKPTNGRPPLLAGPALGLEGAREATRTGRLDAPRRGATTAWWWRWSVRRTARRHQWSVGQGSEGRGGWGCAGEPGETREHRRCCCGDAARCGRWSWCACRKDARRPTTTATRDGRLWRHTLTLQSHRTLPRRRLDPCASPSFASCRAKLYMTLLYAYASRQRGFVSPRRVPVRSPPTPRVGADSFILSALPHPPTHTAHPTHPHTHMHKSLIWVNLHSFCFISGAYAPSHHTSARARTTRQSARQSSG